MNNFNNYKLNKKKRKRVNSIEKEKNNAQKYISNLITRILISIIVLFVVIIGCNSNKNIASFIKNNCLEKNINFTKYLNIYNKYFGEIIPIKNQKSDETVFNEKLTYKQIENYNNGFVLSVSENYLVPIIKSGIVVFSGEKENYGNTIIIQGIDEVDYWYSNVTNLSVKLYEYVSEGELLGTTKGNKLYLVFSKNGNFLDYNEVIT